MQTRLTNEKQNRQLKKSTGPGNLGSVDFELEGDDDDDDEVEMPGQAPPATAPAPSSTPATQSAPTTTPPATQNQPLPEPVRPSNWTGSFIGLGVVALIWWLTREKA